MLGLKLNHVSKRGPWMPPNHYLNQSWNVVNWILGNQLQWYLNHNSYIFIQENAFENVVWKISAILSRPQCVNWVVYQEVEGKELIAINSTGCTSGCVNNNRGNLDCYAVHRPLMVSLHSTICPRLGLCNKDCDRVYDKSLFHVAISTWIHGMLNALIKGLHKLTPCT